MEKVYHFCPLSAQKSLDLQLNAHFPLEGVDRVKRTGRMYAYFMESAMIKYITHKECNLTQIGGLLDAKEYGIGMPVSEFKMQQKSKFSWELH